jgi:hypothetical protein
MPVVVIWGVRVIVVQRFMDMGIERNVSDF